MIPRSGSVGLVVGGQHLFMVQGCGYDMILPDFGVEHLGKLVAGVRGVTGAWFVVAKDSADIVHTYVCSIGAPVAIWFFCVFGIHALIAGTDPWLDLR
jgi:hypothetical protein